MSFIGKLHEVLFYAFITSIVLFVLGKAPALYILFTFVPFTLIAIIGAFITKKFDKGKGLTFNSDKLFVIIFAHIAEEILGLLLTPIWFIKDLITKNWNTWKVIDYTTYFIEVAVALLAIFVL